MYKKMPGSRRNHRECCQNRFALLRPQQLKLPETPYSHALIPDPWFGRHQLQEHLQASLLEYIQMASSVHSRSAATHPCQQRHPISVTISKPLLYQPRPCCRSLHGAARANPAFRSSNIARAGLLEWMSSFTPGGQQVVQQDRDRLMRLLLGGQDSQELGSPNAAANAQEVDDIVERLSNTNLPFRESRLGGGPWVVLHTKGNLQLWRATYNVGSMAAAAAKRTNTASQDFNPKTRSAVNRAEYFGGDLWVTASGSYEPMDDATSCPKPVRALIQGGRMNLWGTEIPLTFIKGTGVFEVTYLDDELRVFKSGGSIAVQVKAAALEKLRRQFC